MSDRNVKDYLHFAGCCDVVSKGIRWGSGRGGSRVAVCVSIQRVSPFKVSLNTKVSRYQYHTLAAKREPLTSDLGNLSSASLII